MKRRILTLTKKEVLHIIRDPRSLYLALILPVALLILFGFAITFDLHHLPIGIVDQDRTSLSRDLISSLSSSEYFTIRFIKNNYSGLEPLLEEGKVKLILAFPPQFSGHFARGEKPYLQLLIDGSDNNTAQVALGYLSRLIQTFSIKKLAEKLKEQSPLHQGAIPPIRPQPRIWYNPELKSANFIIPGLIAVVMMVLTVLLTSLTIAREWETGTMEQLIITPAKASEIIIGKVTPYLFLGYLQISLVILIGTILFSVPFKGSLILLGFASGIFLVCGLGIGLLVSTVSKSQQLAFMLSIIFTLLPSFLLSGFIFPISSMPPLI
ncbi:MAG: ABC transporter permease, partial [Candidatus Aminicenantales bacterium]